MPVVMYSIVKHTMNLEIKLRRSAGYPLTMELVDTELPKKSSVKISQIRILSTKRIGKRIANASDEELALIIDGLNEIIGG